MAEEAELDPVVDALVAIAAATFCSRTTVLRSVSDGP